MTLDRLDSKVKYKHKGDGMKDHRGEHRRRLASENHTAIKEWFDKNPDGMMKDCCRDLELSHVTVGKYVKVIRDEIK